ncbi:MAG: DUF393 domain-containing protein [Brumimicrobium sp.]
MERLKNIDDKRIVFYDGGCGFCNSSVQRIIDKKKKAFYFTAIQSDFAKEFLEKKGVKVDMTTLYYWEKGKLFDKSSAVIRIAKDMKGLYPLIYYFGILFPKPIRDYIYLLVARNRHKIKSSHRVSPKKDGEELFIDYKK